MAIDSLLGPVFAGILMVELGRRTLLTLREHESPWKRYVYDTISYKKKNLLDVSSKLNSYHDNFHI